MSDANDNNDGRGGQGSGPGGRAPLTLKPRGGSVNAGTVRQSFSHGRSKTVVVETKRRRAPGPGERPEVERPVVEARPRPAPSAPAAPPSRPQAPPAAGGGANLNLSQSE